MIRRHTSLKYTHVRTIPSLQNQNLPLDNSNMPNSSKGKGKGKAVNLFEGYDDDTDESVKDSGYGGSVIYVSGGRSGSITESEAASSKRLRSQIQQLHYNDTRVALDRAISTVLQILTELQDENKAKPICFPTNTTIDQDDDDDLLNSLNSRIAKKRSSVISARSLERSITSNSDRSLDDINGLDTSLPRLVTPQVQRNFNILKLDLKLGNGSANVIDALEKASVASLLEEKIVQSMRHLLLLRDRIDDTSSKVFVTGDLNAGKSTFCNALLRRKILPEDQQPCTSVFCEVIDSRENKGIEEVHSVEIGVTYDILDESTYDVFPLDDLEDLVLESDKYSILKVYVDDHRPIQQSLLRNGVVDIALIDAPGLNLDSYQTTQVFSRQEEIDLVVFVVSAENHFTLSAKEFIAAAAAEKSLIFIVVNKFDNIRDQARCRRQIMDQVSRLAPETHKDASEFVHFVSSADTLEGTSKNPGGGDGGGNDPDNDDNGGPSSDPNFDRLEANLRNFVLEKRAISKLAPAKTYLLNVINDLVVLADINKNITGQEREKTLSQLNQIIPEYDYSISQSQKVQDHMDELVSSTCSNIYNTTKNDITEVIEQIGKKPLSHYYGVFDAYNYANETQTAIIESITNVVSSSEDFTRNKTAQGVEEIKKVGNKFLKNGSGENNSGVFMDREFRGDLMFKRSRDLKLRNIQCDVEFSDFFDISLETFIPGLTGISKRKDNDNNSTTIMSSITLLSVIGGGQLLQTAPALNFVYQVAPFLSGGMIKKVALPLTLFVTVTTIGLILRDIKRAVPHNLARKIKAQADSIDYVHKNSERLSKECRKILNVPIREVSHLVEMRIEDQKVKKEKLTKLAKETDDSYKYFSRLFKRVTDEKRLVESFNLEAISNTID